MPQRKPPGGGGVGSWAGSMISKWGYRIRCCPRLSLIHGEFGLYLWVPPAAEFGPLDPPSVSHLLWVRVGRAGVGMEEDINFHAFLVLPIGRQVQCLSIILRRLFQVRHVSSKTDRSWGKGHSVSEGYGVSRGHIRNVHCGWSPPKLFPWSH